MQSPNLSSLTGPAVDVWLARLDLSVEPSAGDLGALSTDELHRAARMAVTPRRRFVGARTVLRKLIAAYLSEEAKNVEFSYTDKGKPRLGTRHAQHGLHFSVSHSQNRALFAFGRSPLGVDLERIRPLRNLEKLAGRYLSAHEYRTLNQLPASVRSRAFFACWTRKEAYVKAIGTGIGLPLRSFRVTLTPGLEPAVLRESGQRDPDWTLCHLEPEVGVVGALAVRHPTCSLRCWDLGGLER